jgi:hypothetical protein
MSNLWKQDWNNSVIRRTVVGKKEDVIDEDYVFWDETKAGL